MNKNVFSPVLFALAVILIMPIPSGCSEPVQQQPAQQQQQAPTSPQIGVNTNQITVDFKEGQDNTVTKQLVISNTGGGVMLWAARKSAAWLWMEDPQGAIEKGYTKNLDVFVTASGQVPGTYKDAIVIEASGAKNSPQTVQVIMNVVARPAAATTETGAAKTPTPPPPWEYNEYKNDNYDFIFRYPRTYFSKQISVKGAVVSAVSEQGTQTSDNVMVVVLGGSDYKSLADEWAKEAIRYLGGKANLKTLADNKTTLGDGVTTAYEILYESKSTSTGAYQCYVLGVQKKSRYIFFGAVCPLASAPDKLQIWQEMGRTLEFN